MPHELQLREEHFYSRTREGLILSLSFLLTYVVAFTLLSRRRMRSRILRYIGAVNLTLAVLQLTLIPLTVMAKHVILNYSAVPWIEWLDTSLLISHWHTVHAATMVSHLLMTPLGLLWSESSYSSHSADSDATYAARRVLRWQRVKEVGVTLLLIWALGLVMAMVLNKLVHGSLIVEQPLMILHHIMVAYGGYQIPALACRGSHRAYTYVSGRAFPSNSAVDVDQVRMQRQSLEVQLDHSDTDKATIQLQIHDIDVQLKTFQLQREHEWVFRVALLMILCLVGLLAVQLTLNSVANLFTYLKHAYTSGTTEVASYRASIVSSRVERIESVLGKTSTYLGWYGSLMEFALVTLFSSAVIVGWAVGHLKNAKAEDEDMTLPALDLLKSAQLLVITQAVPIAVHILDISSINLLAQYKVYDYSEIPTTNSLLISLAYKLSMLYMTWLTVVTLQHG